MDVHTPEQRSKNMRAIKATGTKDEVRLAKALWHLGYRYRKNNKSIFGKPDLTFKKYKVAVFVDSEFFHGKDWETEKFRIKSNQEFWQKKIGRNIERDHEVNKYLIDSGWTVLRFWSKEVKKNLQECIDKIINVIDNDKSCSQDFSTAGRKSKKIDKTYDTTPYMAIQNIIRCIDTILPFFVDSEKLSDAEISVYKKLIEYGWPRLLKPYYFNIDINKHLPFAIMTKESIRWTTSNLFYFGQIELCRQLLSYDKADLLKFEEINDQHYTFTFCNSNNDVESFDRKSFDFYIDNIAKKFVEEKRKTKYFDETKIKSDFKKLIRNPFGRLISYDTTPEIDDYYNEEGHYRLLMMQGYDDFDNKDVFGGIEYWKYITIVELIIGVGLKHTDACFMLKEINSEVLPENLLTYTQPKQKAISDYAEYMDWKEDEIQQIFEAITLTKDNFDYYLEYPCTSPPIFIEVGGELLIRSIAGCLSNPFSILNRELKRKYKKDYDRAVNNRENRFRNELFRLFPQNNIIKVPKEINISFNGIKTDIDAVVFDETTGALGLFQLKWQDRYGHSMKERYSRISNLFPKANEWIGKIKDWVSSNGSKSLLNALQIDKKLNYKTEIKEIYLFVISRNQMNFTGVDLDETVAWSSWYQLIESLASVKTLFNDPIREMFLKIKSLNPDKSEQKNQFNDDGEFIIRFDDLVISHKS